MRHVHLCQSAAQLYLRRIAVVALLTSLLTMACDSGTDPNAPQRINLQITPTFTGGAATQPITRVRVSALASGTNEALGDTVINTTQATGPWSVPIDVAKANAQPVIFQVELLNGAVGEWSGVTPAVTIPGGQRDVPQNITFVRGPLANLSVTNVTITPNPPATLPEGDSVRLVATANMTGARAFFRSVNTAVATVDDGGLVRALGPGAARIIAFAGNAADTADITIVTRIANILLTPSASQTLGGIGAELTVTARVVDPRGVDVPGQSVEWIIGNTNVLSMPSPGRFRAIGTGTSQITARAVGDSRVIAVLSVTVNQTPTTVTITPANPTLESIGAKLTLSATVRDAGGTVIAAPAIIWSTDNAAVASVNAATGEVTANSAGTAVIRAQSGGVSGQVTVTVQQRVSTLTLNPTTVSFNAVGATAQITATATDQTNAPIPNPPLTWTTSNTAVATVSSSGLITAVGNGNATITATAASGVQRTVNVTVQQQVVSLSVNPNFVLLESLGATATPAIDARDPRGNLVPASALTITSNNPSVATVNANGVITAVTNGAARIDIVAGALSTGVNVTVAQRAVSLRITPDTLRFTGIGQSIPVTATLRDALGNEVVTFQAPNWSVDNATIATVGGTISGGTAVVAVANGTTTLRASIGTVTGTAAIIVNQQPTTVRISPNPLILTAPGTSAGVIGQVVDGAGNVVTAPGPITFSTADPSIATVNATTGLVTGVSVGTTTLTATSGGITGTATVHVNNTVARIELLPSNVVLTALQDSLPLTVRAYDAQNRLIPAPVISWGNTDADVVTITPWGTVYAVSNGVATIRVISGTAFADTRVEVRQVPVSLTITTVNNTLIDVGTQYQIEFEALDRNGFPVSPSLLNWRSSNENIASIGADGIVTGLAAGTVTFTVTAGTLSRSVTLIIQ